LKNARVQFLINLPTKHTFIAAIIMKKSIPSLHIANRFTQLPGVQAIGRKNRPFEDVYHFVLTLAWWKFFLFIALVYLLVNALFAMIYFFDIGSVQNARPGSFGDAFFFSVQTLATIGYGEKYPATIFANLVVTLEAFCGILGTALVTGLTFAKFARPTARVLFSEKMVVTQRNGTPTLMFRMANWRHNQILEARLRVIILLTEISAEGDVLRRPHEIVLVRANTALFGLTWLAMHEINETSVFYGEASLERLRAQNAEIFISLTGFDETFSQTVHTRHYYALDDIIWNARFADVFATYQSGKTRRIDYTHFHKVIPTTTTSTSN